MDGTAAVGTSTRLSRQDHVHPSDTSRAPVASPAFTGTVTAPSISLTSGSAISMPAVNAGMEIGSITTANTPFIDFHTSGANIDYDVRIIAGGGNGTIGMGGLTITA